MKYLYIIIILLPFISSAKGKKYDSSTCSNFNERCRFGDNQQWRFINSGLERKYGGNSYQLIDTTGVFVYSKTGNSTQWIGHLLLHKKKTEFFFSLSPCDKMYALDYFKIKKKFNLYPNFYNAVKRQKTEELGQFYQSDSSVINLLYHQFVK